MTIKYKFLPTKRSTPHEVSYWQPATPTEKGKRRRFYRKTRAEAMQLKSELEKKLKTTGVNGVVSATTDKRDADSLRSILSILPEEIRDVTHLAQAVTEWTAKLYSAVTPVRIEIAVDQFITYKRGKVSEGYIKNRLIPSTRLLLNALSGSDVSTITTPELEEIIENLADDYAEESIFNKTNDLRTFFKWATEEGMTAINPALKLETNFTRDETPKFFTPEEVELLFSKCLELDEGLAPALAMTFFGYVRPEELSRIVAEFPNDIRPQEQEVYVRREVAKGKKGHRRARMISGDIKLPLWDWVKTSDTVDMTDFVTRRRKVYRAAGLEWFNSAGRHCCLTYACQLENPSRVADWCGHTTERTAKQHYRGVVSRSLADSYAAITPDLIRRKYQS